MTPPDLTTALAELALMLWQHEESLASWAERNPGGLFFPDDFIACAKRRAAAAGKIHDGLRAGRASEGATRAYDITSPRYSPDCECMDCVLARQDAANTPTPPPAGARDEDVEAVREALDVLPDEDSVTHRAAVDALDRIAARLAEAERNSKRLSWLIVWLANNHWGVAHQLGGDPQEIRKGIDAALEETR